MVEAKLSALQIADKEGILKRWPHELGHTAVVEVNPDDFMPPYFKFELTSSKPILPPHIVIYGKGGSLDDALYVNFWLPIFAKTVEKGGLEYYQPERWSANVLCVGLPRQYRFMNINFDPQRLIEFAIALFGGKAYGVALKLDENTRAETVEDIEAFLRRLAQHYFNSSSSDSNEWY